jgi:hypothetical protein
MRSEVQQVTSDYAFYEVDLRPPELRWVGWLVVPLRRILWRLLRPAWLREQELLERIGADIDRLETNLVETVPHLTERLDALERQHHASAAAGWDVTALARRLTSIEDRLIGLADTGVAGRRAES